MEKNGEGSEQKFAWKLLILSNIIVAIVVVQTLASNSSAPNIIMDSSAIAGGLAFVLMIYLCKEDISTAWNYFLGLAGIYIGFFANISLSTGFVSKPSYIFIIISSLIISFLFWKIFTLHKDINPPEKLVFVFLGCWVASLFLALLGFSQGLIQWLSLLPQQERIGGHIQVEASVIINILKSLFLSSVFNVLERIMRIM